MTERVSPVASLPMYDWPEVREAMDGFWSGLHRHLSAAGIDAPAALDRRDDYKSIWLEPGLILSQTCGYPYVTRLRGQVQLVATPCYRAAGCEGPTYRSFLLVRRDSPFRRIGDLRGSRAIANSEDSQSGYSALRAVIAPHASRGRFFGEVTFSRGHRASMQAVAAGKADICATDAVCAALARRHLPDLMRELRIVAKSPAAPGLPFITATGTSPQRLAALRKGLAAAMRDKSLASARDALLLDGIEVLDDQAYDRVARIEARAIALGYPTLA